MISCCFVFHVGPGFSPDIELPATYATGEITAPGGVPSDDIKDQKDVTKAVLSELERAKNPRFKEIMSAAVGTCMISPGR